MAATYGSVAGVIYLSLADFYTIIFSSLLILAVLESKILKKHVDSNEWLTIIFGFVGVVIAVQYTDSSTSTLSWVGVGVTCLASLSLALVILSTRASGSESNYALSFWPQVVNCLVCIGVLLASEGVVTNRTGITFSLYAG